MATNYCKLQREFPWLTKLVGRDTNHEIHITRLREEDKEWLVSARFLLSPPIVLLAMSGEVLGDVRPTETTTEAISRVGAGLVQWIVTVKQHTIIIYKPPIEFSLPQLVIETVPL